MVAGVIALFVVALAPLAFTISRIVYINKKAPTVATAEKSTNGSLVAGKAAGSRVTFAVRFGAISIGWFFVCVGASPWVLPYSVWPVQFFSIMPMWPAGACLMLLSVRPTDEIGTLVATPFVQLGCAWFGLNLALFIFDIAANAPNALPTVAPIGVIGIVNIVCALLLFRNYFVCANCSKAGSPRVRLSRMWRSFRIFCGAMTVFFFFGGSEPPRIEPHLPCNDNIFSADGSCGSRHCGQSPTRASSPSLLIQ